MLIDQSFGGWACVALIALVGCTKPHGGPDFARVMECTTMLDEAYRDTGEFAALERLALLDEKTPEDCQATDAFKAVTAGLLVALDRVDDAEELLSEIDLETTSVPRALELAFIFSVEGNWQAPVTPRRLAERHIEISPDSPIGYVLLARELARLNENQGILSAMNRAKELVNTHNEKAYLSHAVNLSGFYLDRGDYLEAYRLAYSLFQLYGEEAWNYEGSVSVAAGVAILVGRRREADMVMSELFKRNPYRSMSNYRLMVLAEIARPTEKPRFALPAGEPTIQHLLWPNSAL